MSWFHCQDLWQTFGSRWDRLFGTYTDPDTVPASDPLGLNYEASRWRMGLGIPAQRAPYLD
jgi:hypothetical protein